MAAKRKSTSLAPTPRGPTRLTLAVTYDAPAVAREQAWAETELAELARASFTVEDAESYAATDAFLTEVVTKKDAIEAMRSKATTPIQESLTVIRSWFRPAVDALSTLEHALKSTMGAYLIEAERVEREARAKALAAVQTNNASALVEALTVASEAQSAGETGRATKRLFWKVKRLAEDLLPDQYWTPNMALIEAEAKRQGVTGDEPPVIPGVVFERVAAVGARR